MTGAAIRIGLPVFGLAVSLAPGAAWAATESAGFIDEKFIVALAFILCMAVIAKKIWKGLATMLDVRAEQIRGQLDTARKLREEAQSLLADKQRRQRDAVKEAGEIVAAARSEAEHLKKRTLAELDSAIRRREQQAADRIAQAEAAALQEVRERAVETAMAAAIAVLESELDAPRRKALVDAAIKDVAARVH